jgi:hypothetical protein
MSGVPGMLGTKTKREHIEIWSRRAYLPSGDHFKEFAEECQRARLPSVMLNDIFALKMSFTSAKKN